MLDIKLKLKHGHMSERSWMEPSALRKLCWNITYACNYRCQICFTNAGRADPDELSTGEGKELIRRAAVAGVRDIIISGGEPFVRPDIVEILAHMAEFDITARIASNGSLLTDDLLERLRRQTLVKSFQISLDALEPGLYGKIHGVSAEACQPALSALRRVQEHGFHTTVSVRLTPETLAEVPALLDRACSEGWATLTIHLPVHTRRTGGAYPQDTDFFSLLAPALDHFCKLPERWLVETYIPWAGYHPVMRRLQQRIRVVHRGCRAGRDRLTVNPTGELSPCVCLDVPQAYVGNVRRDDLENVFENSPICKMFRRPEEHGICADCPLVATCGGGCRAAAFALTGRLDGQDMSCPVWRARKP